MATTEDKNGENEIIDERIQWDEQLDAYDEFSAEDEIYDDNFALDAGLWAGYMLTKYTKLPKELGRRLFSWSKSVFKMPFIKVWSRIKTMPGVSKLVRSMYASFHHAKMNPTQFARYMAKFEAKVPAVFKRGFKSRVMNAKMSASEARAMASSSAKEGRLLLREGEAASLAAKGWKGSRLMKYGSKFFKGLGYLVDIYWTYDIASSTYDRVFDEADQEGAPTKKNEQERMREWDAMMASEIATQKDAGYYSIDWPAVDDIVTNAEARQVSRDMQDLMVNAVDDNRSVLESFFKILDNVSTAIDDPKTGLAVATVMKAAAMMIENAQPFTIIPSKVLEVNVETEMQYFGDALKSYKSSRQLHDSLNVEFMNEAFVSAINFHQFETADPNNQVMASMLSTGYFSNDYRLKRNH